MVDSQYIRLTCANNETSGGLKVDAVSPFVGFAVVGKRAVMVRNPTISVEPIDVDNELVRTSYAQEFVDGCANYRVALVNLHAERSGVIEMLRLTSAVIDRMFLRVEVHPAVTCMDLDICCDLLAILRDVKFLADSGF